MSYYVYIIANKTDGDLYKGFTESPTKRLDEHNAGNSQFISSKREWYFVFLSVFETQREALIFERKIKRLNKSSLDRLIASPQNILEIYLTG